jgi:sec-independent protein translocase protein TatA
VIEGLFSPMHLLVILVVALLVFGPDKLPEIARQVGKAGREFRRVQTSLNDGMGGVFGQDPTGSASPPPASAEPPSAAAPPPATEPTPPGPSAGGPSVGGQPPPTSILPHRPAEGATPDTDPRGEKAASDDQHAAIAVPDKEQP